MATLTLKNIPEPLYERLKHVAKFNHRSLNSQIIYSLERSLGLTAEDPERLRQEAEAFRERIGRKGELSPEEIGRAIQSGTP